VHRHRLPPLARATHQASRTAALADTPAVEGAPLPLHRDAKPGATQRQQVILQPAPPFGWQLGQQVVAQAGYGLLNRYRPVGPHALNFTPARMETLPAFLRGESATPAGSAKRALVRLAQPFGQRAPALGRIASARR